MLKLFASIIFSTVVSTVFAQADFIKKFTFNNWDHAQRVIQTSDSGFAICGTTVTSLYGETSKIVLLKLSKSGDSVWSRQYGPFHLTNVSGLGQLNTGEFLIGYATSTEADLLKTSIDGDSILNVSIDSSGGSQMKLSYSQNIYYAGSRVLFYDYYGNPFTRAVLRRFDKNFNMVWEKDVPSDFSVPAYGTGIFIDDNEKIVVSGNGTNGAGLYVPLAEVADSNGTTSWYLTESEITSLVVHGLCTIAGEANGGVIFSVCTPPPDSHEEITNLDSSHQLLWQKNIPVEPVSINQWSDSTITICGSGFQFFHLNANGDSIGFNDYSLYAAETYGTAKCFDQSVIAVGTTNWISTDSSKFYVVKLKGIAVGIGDDALNFSNTAKVALGSNPAYDQEEFFVTNLAPDKKYSLQIFNNIGQLVFEQIDLNSQTSLSLTTKQIGSGCLIFTFTENNFPIQEGKFVLIEGR